MSDPIFDSNGYTDVVDVHTIGQNDNVAISII